MDRDGAPGRLAMPRRRGAATGLLIVLGGIWCAAVPFVGHYFNLVVGPDTAFDMTAGRFWLSLVPGVVAIVGGLMLLRSRNRATATLGAQLALAAGIWLVIGRELSTLWSSTWAEAPAGGTDRQALELLLYFYGAGAAITALAGVALGRVSARHAGDYERLAGPAATTDDRVRGDRFSRREPVGGAEPVSAEEPAATRTRPAPTTTEAPPPRAPSAR